VTDPTNAAELDPRIVRARELLADLESRPAVSHAEVYEEAHRLLAEVLERPSEG
jgi:hypothetical protein